MPYDFRAIEERVQKHWQEHKTAEAITTLDAKKKTFYALDGPPYVNYVPHVGHIKTTTFKDLWGKFKQMQGYSVWWQPGFDCSGLPIENAVEKKLGIQSKQDIERMGVAKFIAECRNLAEQNKPLWMDLYRKIGAWRGWVEPYLTYKDYYVESGWWTIKKWYEQGLLVRGEKSGFWCSHCETVLAGYEVTDSYKTLEDPSIFVLFPLRTKPGVSLLVWTTTPWTLPSNVAIAVHPEEVYVTVKTDHGECIIAEKRLSELDRLKIAYSVTEKRKGKEMEGWTYTGVVDTPLQKEMDASHHRVVMSIKLLKKRAASKVSQGDDVFEDFVTMDAGTGLVHTAPGLGDNKVGEHYHLPFLSPIDDRGRFLAGAGKYQGLQVKEADKTIIADLQAAGRLLHAGRVTHPYPVCWRCKTPLIYRMSTQWFLKLDTLRDKMLKANKKVRWLPAFAEERFREVLETAPDWAVTRQRYWGIPLPIWTCVSCKTDRVIGSKKELGITGSMHKDAVDALTLKCSCGGEMKRVPDIMDVWFDSGIAPWASLKYPEQKDLFERLWPVDLVDESQDQTRGWFYTLMVCGFATFGTVPYKTVCLNGWMLDKKGDKMSKSVGNVVWAEDAWKSIGADALRLYLCMDVAPWDTQKYNTQGAEEAAKILGVLWNSLQFVQSYCPPAKKPATLQPEDKWLLSRLHSLVQRMTPAIDSFALHEATRELSTFILDDLSRWYIKLIRDRVPAGAKGASAQAASYTVRTALETVARLLAPFCPFVSEALYLDLGGTGSVHQAAWPKANARVISSELEKQMGRCQEVVEAANALRQDKKIKLKWPVDRLLLQSTAMPELEHILRDMCNVKQVEYVDNPQTKAFTGGSLDLGNVLKDEALVRELVRAVQDLRKKNGLQVSDHILLYVQTDTATQLILHRFEKDIRAGTSSTRLNMDGMKDPKGKLEFEGKTIDIGFVKA